MVNVGRWAILKGRGEKTETPQKAFSGETSALVEALRPITQYPDKELLRNTIRIVHRKSLMNSISAVMIIRLSFLTMMVRLLTWKAPLNC